MLVTELVQFLTAFFNTSAYPADEAGGVFYPSASEPSHTVVRIGLALDPGPVGWLIENRIDMLWLHRPWKLDLTGWPNKVVVISHHLPFDEHLTIGYNRLLATALGIAWTTHEQPQVMGYKQVPDFPKRPIGMLADGPERDFSEWCYQITEQFGGYEKAVPGRQKSIKTVAVVGGMNNDLIREAAGRGAELYITGQYREGARKAVDETGMAVIAVGHRRSEEWGLRALATVLQDLGLSVFLYGPK